MNQFLANNLIAIIIFLLLLIFALMAVLVIFLFKLLNQNQQLTQDPASLKLKTNPKAKNDKRAIISPIQESFTCVQHRDLNSVGSCLICEEVFCENCLVEHESMHFCKEHFRIFAHHKWKQITDLKTTPDNPEEGLFIYEFKRELWNKKNIPTFIMTHYKINTDNDYIESFIQLNVCEEEADKLTLELENYKAQN